MLAGPSLFAPGAAGAGAGYTGFADPGLPAGAAFTAAHIAYLTDAADASRIAAVTFDLSPAGATAARVQLATGGTWFACTLRGATATCPTAGASVTFASLQRLAVEAH